MQVECYFIYKNSLVAQIVNDQLTLPNDYLIENEVAADGAMRIANNIGAKLLEEPKLVSVCKRAGNDIYLFFGTLDHFVPISKKRQHVWSQSTLLTLQEASHLAEKQVELQVESKSNQNHSHFLNRLILISTIYQLFRSKLLQG